MKTKKHLCAKSRMGLVLAVFALCACASNRQVQKMAVPMAADQEPVYGTSAWCTSPEILTQDCHLLHGANRLVELKERRFRIAGNKNGDVVLMMIDSEECGLYANDCWTRASNRNFVLIKNALAKVGVSVLSARAVVMFDYICGYYLYLDKDGYTALSAFSLPKQPLRTEGGSA